MSTNPYETDLDRNPANFAALTPLSFLERAASVYPDRGSDLTNLPNTQVGVNKSTRSVINPSICHVLS